MASPSEAETAPIKRKTRVAYRWVESIGVLAALGWVLIDHHLLAKQVASIAETVRTVAKTVEMHVEEPAHREQESLNVRIMENLEAVQEMQVDLKREQKANTERIIDLIKDQR